MSPILVANITKGSSARRLLQYDLVGRDRYAPRRGEIIGSCLPVADPKLLAREFDRVLKEHGPIQNPIYRASLSLPSGMSLSRLDWASTAHLFLRSLGVNPENHPYWISLHNSTSGGIENGMNGGTEHQHIHISVLRVKYRTEGGPRGGSSLWSPPFPGFQASPGLGKAPWGPASEGRAGKGKSSTSKPRTRSVHRPSGRP